MKSLLKNLGLLLIIIAAIALIAIFFTGAQQSMTTRYWVVQFS